MDDRLRADGLTTQQAALLTAVRSLGTPALTEAAAALGTTHQNTAQLVAALERKGMLRTEPDPADKRRRLVPTEAGRGTGPLGTRMTRGRWRSGSRRSLRRNWLPGPR